MFKIKHGYKKNVPSLEVVEVFLVQCNLVDDKYQQNYQVLHVSACNKYYAYELNLEASNLVILTLMKLS